MSQELSRIEAGSLAPAQQEKPRHVSFELVHFELALTTPRVDTVPLDDLKGVLRYAIMKVGLRAANWPTDVEKALLIQHIVTNYGGHTIEEIRLAFDMAITGKLELKDASCYQDFSCLYFSTIMNAYRLWAKEEYKQLNTGFVAIQEPKESLSDKAMSDWLAEIRDRLKAGNYPVSFMPLQLYEWMKGRGEIKMARKRSEYLVMAVDHRFAELTELVHNQNNYDNRALLEKFSKMKAAGEVTGSEILIIENLAKRMILFENLKSKI